MVDREQWEYEVVSLKDAPKYGGDRNTQYTNQLDSFGYQGWELVAVTKTKDGMPTAYFKRKKS